MKADDITLIVPTKNEARNIQSFLKTLPPELALIVVDASDDETETVIKKIRPQNTIVLREPGNIPLARQRGAEHAASEWLLYSDADMAFDNAYFTRLQKMKIADNVGAIMGAKLSLKKYRAYYRCYSGAMRVMSWLGIPIGSGSNMLIRRKALMKTGGFDERLAHSEDSDILIRIKKAGWKVPYKGRLKVYETDHRRLERGVVKKFWHGALRAFYLFTGWRAERVRESDWGYWEKH